MKNILSIALICMISFANAQNVKVLLKTESEYFYSSIKAYDDNRIYLSDRSIQYEQIDSIKFEAKTSEQILTQLKFRGIPYYVAEDLTISTNQLNLNNKVKIKKGNFQKGIGLVMIAGGYTLQKPRIDANMSLDDANNRITIGNVLILTGSVIMAAGFIVE
jgi:hypothetical protein